MNKYVLLEIPIYSMKKDEFYKKWDKYFARLTLDKEADKLIRNHYFPQTVWQYNQIIGYITISISEYDISFDCYLAMNKDYTLKSFQYKSNNKHFVHSIGLMKHFRVEKHESNQNIKNKINEYLGELLDSELLIKYYVNTLVFDTQIRYLNIRKAMNELCE